MPPYINFFKKCKLFHLALLMLWFLPANAQINITFDVNEPSCNGFVDGFITANPTGGTAPYSYLWSNFQSGQTVFGISAGTWSVTVTDASGNNSNASVTVSEPPLLETTIELAGDICLGTDGSLTANTTGGTPPYNFTWTTGETTQTISDLEIGFYIVTVTDANGCKATHGTSVNAPLSVIVKATDVLCYGWCDGAVEAMVMGGTGPYTYLWNTGATDPILDMLPTGTFTVTVTDANGCTATGSGVINEPPDIEIEIAISGQCTDDVDVNVTATGGTGTLTYQWAHGPTTPNLTNLSEGYYYLTVTANQVCKKDTFIVVSNGVTVNPIPNPIGCDSTDTGSVIVEVPNGIGPLTWQLSNGITYDTKFINNLAAGNYSVTVTDGAGCTGTADFEIEQGGSLFDVSVSSTPASCGNICDGTATITPTTGIPPYTYKWDNDETTSSITNLCSGNYSATVSDSTGCHIVVMVNVEEEPSDIVVTATPKSADCGTACNGEITASVVSGGVAPFSFQWDANANNQTTETAINLCPGTYSVTVTDGNGCTAETNATVDENPSDLDFTLSSVNADCGDSCNGTATVENISGGTPPYSFEWDAAANSQTTQTATNLCPGTYSVTVKDANNCQLTKEITVEENPSDLDFSVSSTPTGCENNCSGTATVEDISGGTMPYSFQWDSTANNQTSQTAVDLCAGTYSITVTDANNCKKSMMVEVMDSTSDIELTFETVSVSCTGDCDGSATVTPTGGVAPYTYQWDSTANNQTTQTATDLCVGEYEVIVKDDNGCTASGTVTISQDEPLTILVEVKDATCQNSADGCAEIIGIAPDDNPPYTIQWSNGATDSLVCGLLPGEYEVTVTADNGCEGIVPVTVGSESSVDAQFDWKIDSCLGDSILVTFSDISVVDPPSDVVISWDWTFNTGDTSNLSSVQIWVDASSIDVTLIVENAANCVDTILDTVNINLFDCSLPTQDTTVCQGDELIFTIDCLASDTTATYLWSPADMILSGMNTPSASINTSENGEFDIWVDISSSLGCAYSDTAHVTVIDTSLIEINLSLIGFEQSCDTTEVCFNNQNDPLAFANYTWYFDFPNPNATSNEYEPCHTYTTDGTYTIALVPAADCLDTLMFDVEVVQTPQAAFAFNVSDCSDTVSVKFTDLSVPPNVITEWDWDFGNGDSSDLQNPELTFTDSSQILDVILTVNYDLGGGQTCVEKDTQEVVVRIFTAGFIRDTVVSCGPGEEVELNPDGNPFLQYNWMPNDDLTPNGTFWNPTAVVNDITTFSVQVDTTDCSVQRTVTIIFAEPLNLDLIPDSLILCESKDEVLTAQINMDVANPQFAWFNSSPFNDTLSTNSTLDITVGDPIQYYVVATDENNCSQTDSVLVGNYEIIASIPDTVAVCAGEPVGYEIEGMQDDYTIVWNAFDPQNFVPTDTSTFFVTISNPQNCIYEDDMFINYVDVDALIDVVPVLDTIVLGERVPITATDIPGFSYSWSNGQFLSDPNASNPFASPEEIGLTTFVLDVEDIATGCRSTEESSICVITDLCDYPMIFFPNAFTPNGDGVNDILFVEGLNIDEVYFAIYNRWGEKVFESFSQEEGWDGTFNGEPASGDAFGYYLKVKCAQGGEYFKKGNVTVIR